MSLDELWEKADVHLEMALDLAPEHLPKDEKDAVKQMVAHALTSIAASLIVLAFRPELGEPEKDS